MPRKRDFFHTGLNVSRSDLAGLPFGANPTGAQDYFVDGNAKISEDGEHWDSPVKSLSEAITLSNASIGLTSNRWWARRNRIYCCGDQELTENLTVLPEKCDIIGVGYDIEAMPRVTGSHIIDAIATGKARGTRFFNMGFMNNTAAETFKFLTDHMAIEFYGCKLWPKSTGSSIAISLTDDNRGFKFINSEILQEAGNPNVFTDGIVINGTGQHDMIIKDSYIFANKGIHIHAGTLGYNGRIENCTIRTINKAINDASDLFIVANNTLITSVASDTTASNASFTINLSLAVGNRITAGDDYNSPLPVEGTLD